MFAAVVSWSGLLVRQFHEKPIKNVNMMAQRRDQHHSNHEPPHVFTFISMFERKILPNGY